MQSDRYLRVVLTVIAVCLVWICLRGASVVETASAQGTSMDVNIVKVGGAYVGMALPVKVE